MQKDVDGHVPCYPNIPSKSICLLLNVTLHADQETDEVYAQMTLLFSLVDRLLEFMDIEILLVNTTQALMACRSLSEFEASKIGFCKNTWPSNSRDNFRRVTRSYF